MNIALPLRASDLKVYGTIHGYLRSKKNHPEAVTVICGDKNNQRKNTPARGVFYSHADLADFRRKANRSTLAAIRTAHTSASDV